MENLEALGVYYNFGCLVGRVDMGIGQVVRVPTSGWVFRPGVEQVIRSVDDHPDLCMKNHLGSPSQGVEVINDNTGSGTPD